MGQPSSHTWRIPDIMRDDQSTINHAQSNGSHIGVVPRRSFLKHAGAVLLAASSSALLARNTFGQRTNGGVSLGTGDVAVLNFAYALEQLEAAFYKRVTDSFYSGANGQERELLGEIREHEATHRSFLRNALGASAIPDLEVNFSSVNFRNRQSVLATAITFEDTGVAAYNGAGQLLRSTSHLLAAGKIVSVEARHAATLRDLLRPRSTAFAGDDVVDSFGLGAVLRPSEVLNRVAPFIRTPIDPASLPQKK